MRVVPKLLLSAIVVLATSSCASMPDDQGRGEVAALLRDRGHPTASSSKDAERLLADMGGRPLGVADAVSIALVGNPRVKGEYARLGFASAEVYDAGRLSNPRLSFGYLFVDEAGAADKIDLGITQSFTNLILLPARSRLAQAEFERVQRSVAAAIQDLAAQAESAWYAHVGARQTAAMRETVARAARLSAELAQRFFDAGNITRLELSREQAAATQAQIDALQAQADVSRTRLALAQVMGLSPGKTAWEVAARMPTPLPEEDDLDALLKLADGARLDLAAARGQVQKAASALGTTRRFRYLGEVELGVQAERDTDRTRHLGPTLSLELPIFNQKAGTVARAEAELQTAEAELATLELDLVTGIHGAHAAVLNARARAEQYRAALIPQRESIVARTQEQVNYMLVGQFELLLAKQQEYDAYQGYLEAVRDYWQARAELTRAVGTALPSSARTPGEVLDVEDITRPKAGGMPMDHDGMQMDDSGDGMKGMDHDAQQKDKPSGDMKDMQHDMPGMEKPGSMKGKKATPKKDAAPSMPPPRKGEEKSDMPTGMESHIPEPAGKPAPAPKKSDESEEPQHGDHP